MAFSEKTIVDVYIYALKGWTDKQIAKAINVTDYIFEKYKKREGIEYALDKAREEMTPVNKFHEFVYNKLPTHIKEIWDRINRYDKIPSAVQKIEQILNDEGEEVRQHLFFYALVNSNFNPTEACHKVNISFKKVKKWIDEDPEFAELMNEINMHKGNFFESALIKKVAAGDTQAVIFANKTFNKERGYGEKFEVNHTGEIQHKHMHAVIKLDSLDLPLEIRKQILEAVRKVHQIEFKEENKSDLEFEMD